MNLHPFERFLGVPHNADPYTLLGLAPERTDALAIDESMRRKLAEVFRHPDGRSDDAEVARAAVREAADTLRKLVRQQVQPSAVTAQIGMPNWMQQAVRSRNRPRPHAPVPLNLTAFDRLVLATLVACGGWNARSRAQLVALAQQYGVGVQGLLRVMHGLSTYARSGGPRIGVTDIASRPSSVPLAPVGLTAPPPIGIALLDRLADNLGHELKRGGAWPTIKLAIVFGLATVVIGIIGLRAMLTRSSLQENAEPGIVANSDTHASRATTSMAPSMRPDGLLVARFATSPTFLGNGLPGEAVNAVDRLRLLPSQLDELARRISVAQGEPSDAVYRQWEADIDTIALAWTLADASTRNIVDKAITETLRAAGDTPSVSDRLLKAMVPPMTVVSPLDLIRGTWMAGTLARIGSSTAVQPVVSDRARSLLEVSLSQNVRGSMTYEAAGDIWLSQRVAQLVQMLPFDEKAYDSWELWLASQRALGEGDRERTAIVYALQAILETDYDLATAGPPINVAARLLKMAIQSSSSIARQRVLDLFDNERVSSRDLWVMTSLMHDSDSAKWFPGRLLVPEDADMAHRWRIRDDLSRAWPVPQEDSLAQQQHAGPPAIDPLTGEHWNTAVIGVLEAGVGRDQTTLMQQMVDASRLTEAAAALMIGSPGEAQRLLRVVESGWQTVPVPVPPTSRPGLGGSGQPRSGQPIGADGVWAARYAQAGRNVEARSELLRSLRTTAGTDLGPVDAALLVREAYRGSPTEVRTVAQLVVADHFATGPSIALQMLDQLPDAPSTESISGMIQQLTGRMLPSVRTSAWASEARLALVHHALALVDRTGSPVDAMLESLIESYTGRLALSRDDASVSSTPTSPQEAASLLLRSMMEQAEFAAPIEAVPADLPNLQRRHNTRMSLAEGPIQHFVAHQLALLDVTAYLIVAEQPSVRDRVVAILNERASSRLRTANVLEQSLEVELAMLELWRVRLGMDAEGGVEEDNT